jgi:hypothetical protein
MRLNYFRASAFFLIIKSEYVQSKTGKINA